MPSNNRIVQTYVALAAWYHRQGQGQNRDRFLALAADAALNAGLPEEAEQLHGRLVRYNPHHLLKPFPSFAQAMQSPLVKNFVAVLRRSHPPEEAQHLLASLGGSIRSGPEPREQNVAKAEGLWTNGAGLSRESVAALDVAPFEVSKENPAVQTESPFPQPRSSSPTRVLPKEPPRPPAAPAYSTATLSAPTSRPESPTRSAAPSGTPAAPAKPQVPPLMGTPDDSPARTDHAWMVLGLFLSVLLAGAALGTYTLAKPFLLP